MMWRFINTGFRSGKFNMEYDEYLAKRLLAGKGEPTVRVYGWKPYAISLGYHQSEEDINREKCREGGIDIVRRPTGGRAILHAEEVTYSVVTFADGRSIAETHERISGALVAALKSLGVDAEMARSSVDLSEFYEGDSAVSCFASITRCEVQHQGKKVIGSAQRRYTSPELDRGTVLLQHGSILVGKAHRQLPKYLSSFAQRTRGSLEKILENKTIEVETILRRPVSFDEVVDAIRKSFEDVWHLQFFDERYRLNEVAVLETT